LYPKKKKKVWNHSLSGKGRAPGLSMFNTQPYNRKEEKKREGRKIERKK
jgi:hypothetical protein